MKTKSFAILLAATTLAASTAYADTTNWTLAYLAVKGTIYEEVALGIPDRIAAATDNQVIITPNSSLIAGDRLLEAVRDGVVQMSLPLTFYYTGSQPLFTVPSLPGISESYDDLTALSASSYGDQVRDLYNVTYNATELMQTAFCPQTLFSTVPITSLEEWDGRKLRVNNRGTGLIAAKLGAIPVSMSAGEVLPALERGAIEGVITDSCWAYGAGFGAVVTHASDWKLGSVVPSPVLVNNNAWRALTPELQTAILEEFEQIEVDFEARWRERTSELLSLWREAGIEFSEISDAETARVYDDSIQSPVIEAWSEDMASAGLDAAAVLATALEAVK